MNSHLTKPIALKEIKYVVFQMGGMKAPGPDGLHGVFYHSFWDIIVDDVNGLVQDFVTRQESPRRLYSENEKSHVGGPVSSD